MHEAVVCMNRELQTSTDIVVGTVLMKLPQKTVLVNRPYLDDEYTKLLMKLDSVSKERREDWVLAVYLARNPDSIGPYLDSLPDRDTLDPTLPTRWTYEDLTRRLQGSPLLRAIERAKTADDNDFLAIKKVLNDGCPSRGALNHAMALVESRAFGLDSLVDAQGAAVPAMLPLLDMCNHVRGLGPKKNLSYSFEDGEVIVRAVRDLFAGETFSITYGALSNGHLLLKYGFALQDNLEPDGSSNDTFELDVEGRVTFLQTGPKSYAYGKFVQALESFYDRRRCATEEKQEEKSDVDDFLEECDAANGEDFNWEDDDDNNADTVNAEDDDEDIEEELRALAKFEATLLDEARGYGEGRAQQVSKLLATPLNTPDHYSAILVHSELRIISFYLLAIASVRRRLEQETSAKKSSDVIIDLKGDDLDLIEQQADELTNVYMQIRHPFS